jgi:hypothetical protein
MSSERQQWRRIEHRSPSRVLRCALLTVHGVVFKNPDKDLEQEFVPVEEAENFYGSVDGYVAHRLLTACGYTGMVERER